MFRKMNVEMNHHLKNLLLPTIYLKEWMILPRYSTCKDNPCIQCFCFTDLSLLNLLRSAGTINTIFQLELVKEHDPLLVAMIHALKYFVILNISSSFILCVKLVVTWKAYGALKKSIDY